MAVIVENGGYGGAQAAPIASLLVEKYLGDSISTERLALVDDVTNRNLMPNYLVRNQFKADSSRAADRARITGDSTNWIRYQTPSFRYMMLDTSYNSKSPLYINLHKAPPYKSALAERLAKQRQQAAAAAAQAAAAADAAAHAAAPTAGLDSNKAGHQPDSGRRATIPARLPDSVKKIHPPRPSPKKDTSGAPDSPAKSAGADNPIHKDSTR